jgi:hypothetical protein
MPVTTVLAEQRRPQLHRVVARSSGSGSLSIALLVISTHSEISGRNDVQLRESPRPWSK